MEDRKNQELDEKFINERSNMTNADINVDLYMMISIGRQIYMSILFFPIINLIIMKFGQRLELKLSSVEPEVTEPVCTSHKSRPLHFQPL